MVDMMPAWTPREGIERSTTLFEQTWGGEPDGVWASPGRVNVIGEHVDYNGGLCLPIALPHRTYVAMRRRDDDVIRLVTELSTVETWTGTVPGIEPGAIPSWVAYAAGLVWVLRQDGHRVTGFDAAISSCVPLSAGLSSSAAVGCAVGLAITALNGLDVTPAELAALCVRAENHVVGAPTGGLDQSASLRASAGCALVLDCRDGSARSVPFDLDALGLALLVIDTRAAHALVDGQYAARRASCHEAAEKLHVPTLREVDDLDDALDRLDDPVQRARVRHVVTEIARVKEFVVLLEAGRLGDAGPLLTASHVSLRDDYEVSCTELDLAVDTALAAGALGARMTGGGFGGSAIALLPANRADEVADVIASAFAAANLREPGFLIAVASGPGSTVWRSASA